MIKADYIVPCSSSITYNYPSCSNLASTKLHMSNDGKYLYGVVGASCGGVSTIFYKVDLNFNEIWTITFRRNLLSWDLVVTQDYDNLDINVDVPIYRILTDNGAVDIVKSFSGVSICNNSATFSNSKYTYFHCWSLTNILIIKLNSSDFSVLDSYKYNFPSTFSNVRSFCDKLKISDNSEELLFTIGNDLTLSTYNFILLKHDFNSAIHPVIVKEVNGGSLAAGKTSRFKRYIDYDNSKGYLICAFKSQSLFFIIDLDTISLIKGFYYFSPADTTSAAGDLNMNSSNGYIHISFISSLKSYIYTYNPSSDTFLDTYVTSSGSNIYGIAAIGDTLYLSIIKSSNLILKKFNIKASSDTDSSNTLSKSSLSLAISSDFSVIDSSYSITGSTYTPVLSASPPPSLTSITRNTISSYDSTTVCNVTVVIPVPTPTPVSTSPSTSSVPTPSNSNVSTSLESPTAATQTMSYTMAGTTPITMTFNAVTMMTASGSFQNFWSLINEYQLYETLVIMGVYIPDQLVQFWITVQPSIFSFSFMNKVFPNPMVAFDSFKSDQTNDAYTKIGIKYQSLLANKIFFLISIFAILTIDLILTPILIRFKRKYSGLTKKLSEWLLSFLHFKIYIRSLIESFLFTMICGIDEINKYFSNYSESNKNPASLIITVFCMILMNAFAIFVSWHYFKTSWNINENQTDKFTSEIYLDVKKDRRGRSYTFAFILRRLAISALVVLSVGRLNFITIICLFSLIQILAIAYSVCFRPMIHASSNFIEIMNNFIFWMVSTSLVYFSSKDKWFGGATYAVMGLLVTSSIIVCTISFAKFIDGILNYIKNKKKIKNNVTPVDLKNKQNTKINSIISQTNFNENSQIDHSQQRINFDRPKYVSTEIISNHMIEEVKVGIKQQQFIKQRNYSDLSDIKSDILSIMK